MLALCNEHTFGVKPRKINPKQNRCEKKKEEEENNVKVEGRK
jgi:hypothetical protein